MLGHHNNPNWEPFEVGQKVWLNNQNLAITANKDTSQKYIQKVEGPFQIHQRLSPVTYKLDLPHNWKIHNWFHALLLTPYKKTSQYGPNFFNPPPDHVDSFEEYEVEKIIKHKRTPQGMKYLIR
ncbi:hypothetical protein AN958_09957 [Leucoagaricus sp. SymC.cos]|nr:hypothetical protein AN958_09957 [Leucoagaricus sp. SymC.cos]